VPRKLHIGGHERREGWEILDANAGPLVDHVGDAGDLSRFADGSFAEL
jgi:predicted SAM-dependent methyltransferase